MRTKERLIKEIGLAAAFYRKNRSYMGRGSYPERAARARHRRTRQLRRIYGMLCASVILSGFLVSFLLFGVTSHADENGKPLHKYYTSVLVKDPATLEEMADRYADSAHYRSSRDYFHEVCEINHLSADEDGIPRIAPGNYVILPYYSSELL